MSDERERTLEDELTGVRAVLERYKAAVAVHQDNGAGWCTGCHSRLTGKCSVRVDECRTLAALRRTASPETRTTP